MRRSAFAVVVLAGALLGGCASVDTTRPPAETSPAADVGGLGTPEVVATGLAAPWSVVFTAAGTPIVSERDSGRILEVLGDGATREVGVVGGVVHGGEGGLLGLALDGAGRLYAYSTGADGNRIQRFGLGGGPGAYALGGGETILAGLPSAGIHNGGRIAFGPDGMLYAGVGDAGRRESAQDPGSRGGKILRMTPDGQVPQDNPFAGSLVYSAGHRNVQGLGWTADGAMLASEFGQDTWDELNVIVPGGNYGWPDVEGMGGADGGFTSPVQQWSTADASPSGLAVDGDAVYLANLRGQVLRAVPVMDPSRSAEHFAGEYGRIRDVVLGPDGRLWLLTNNTDGRGKPGADDDKLLAVEVE